MRAAAGAREPRADAGGLHRGGGGAGRRAGGGGGLGDLDDVAEQRLVDRESRDLVVVGQVGELVDVPLLPGLRPHRRAAAHVATLDAALAACGCAVSGTTHVPPLGGESGRLNLNTCPSSRVSGQEIRQVDVPRLLHQDTITGLPLTPGSRSQQRGSGSQQMGSGRHSHGSGAADWVLAHVFGVTAFGTSAVPRNDVEAQSSPSIFGNRNLICSRNPKPCGP